jgi:hypothetical protein
LVLRLKNSFDTTDPVEPVLTVKEVGVLITAGEVRTDKVVKNAPVGPVLPVGPVGPVSPVGPV